MINAADLRIGNLVCSYSDTGDVVVVENIHGDGINWCWQYDSYFPEYESSAMYGVPVTEDWLLKLGFEKFGDFQFKGDMFVIEKFNNDANWNLRLSCGPDLSKHLCEILNIHHLQNIVYVLSGQELPLPSNWNDLPFKD